MERTEIAIIRGSANGSFDAVIARYVFRIDRAHPSGAVGCILRLAGQPFTPARGPAVKSGRVDEMVTCSPGPVDLMREIAKCKSEIGAVARHQVEQFGGKIKVARFFGKQSDLVADAFMKLCLVVRLKRSDCCFRQLEALVVSTCIIAQDRQQRFS